MAEEFHVEKIQGNQIAENGNKIIDESNYLIHAPKQYGPAAIGKGGDPLFRNIRATKAELQEILDEVTTVQDWVQKETCNNVALSCLNNENLKDIYFEIKDGFGEFGPMVLMGYKTPQGVEIPRLQLLDKNGGVINVLTGPMAIDELNRRALAYKQAQNGYEPLDIESEITAPIEEYQGNIAE